MTAAAEAGVPGPLCSQNFCSVQLVPELLLTASWPLIQPKFAIGAQWLVHIVVS